MVTKNTKPEDIELDYGSLKNGSVDVLIHWNIVEKTDSESKIYYEYNEERVKIQVPSNSESEILAYISENSDRLFRIVGAILPSDEQWKADIECALLSLAGGA